MKDLVITPFSDKQGLFIQIKIPYQGPLLSSGSLPRIKLDLSKEETLSQDPFFLPLIHGYLDKDMCEAQVACYSLYEIFAEKLRALAQRTRPRDLYDVVHLMDHFDQLNLDQKILQDVLRQKFDHKGLSFHAALKGIPEAAWAEAKSDWEIMLKHQVHNLDPIEAYLQQFAPLFQWVVKD